jgi:DNA-binding NarL/FixJ family response regulator
LKNGAPAAAFISAGEMVQDVEIIRVCVAHGVPLINAGIRAILSSAGEFELAPSGPCGVIDVLIADLETGLGALGSDRMGPRVLIVGQDDGEAGIRKALEKGVRGFLLQTCEPDELRNAVKTVNRGGTAFSSPVTDRIVQSLAFQPLTARELDILHLIVHGLSDKDMARKLVIAPGTVKSHVKAILTKLGAARRTEAAAIAQRRGLARLHTP